MGRPIKSRYFGKYRNPPLGGAGVASFGVSTAGSYSDSAIPTFTVSVPQLTGGVRATGTPLVGVLSAAVTVAGSGYNVGDILLATISSGVTSRFVVATLTGGAGTGVASVTVNIAGSAPGVAITTGAKATTHSTGSGNDLCTLTMTYKIVGGTVTLAGSGYTSATTTFSGGVGSLSVTLASEPYPVIAASAYTVTGGANRTGAEILKQSGSHRFLVKTSDGTAACKLVHATPAAAGQMTIAAQDSVGGTYFVTKITDRKAWLYRNSGTAFANGQIVKWTFGTAVLNTSVKIVND